MVSITNRTYRLFGSSEKNKKPYLWLFDEEANSEVSIKRNTGFYFSAQNTSIKIINGIKPWSLLKIWKTDFFDSGRKIRKDLSEISGYITQSCQLFENSSKAYILQFERKSFSPIISKINSYIDFEMKRPSMLKFKKPEIFNNL
jgi:hypothetical protein